MRRGSADRIERGAADEQVEVGAHCSEGVVARSSAGLDGNRELVMLRMPVRALQTFAFFLFCLCPTLTEAGSLAGSVVGIAGQVFVDRSGQRSGLRLGDQVFVDDAFSVATGAKLKLRMTDGSILSLAENTALRIDAYVLNGYGQRQSAVMSLGGGLIRAITAPGGQPSVFEINTAVSASGARSTDWFVGVLTAPAPPGSRLSGSPPGSAYVVVLGGTVALKSRATGREVLIQPRYGSEVLAGQDPHPPVLHTQAELDRLVARTELP